MWVTYCLMDHGRPCFIRAFFSKGATISEIWNYALKTYQEYELKSFFVRNFQYVDPNSIA